MWHHLAYMINRYQLQPIAVVEAGRPHYPIAIRRARDGDVPHLHDLAELDSARPLAGPVLVAVVEGRVWAALALDGDRVIADPFLPTAPAVELLRLRVAQLRAADARPQRSLLPRWIAGRARA
ncbi:MAG: hypothetical protein QOG42_588 [Solirubrobacteraceae bacterium]|nr:hypothetical protein [Solirubrobacteraceae bacterium]